MTPAAVVLLAGGAATRLPGKLALETQGIPLLVHTYRAVAPGRTVVISMADCAGVPPELNALVATLPCRVVVDREPGRGPLGGLMSAFATLEDERVFAVAGDMPHVDTALLVRLEAAWQADDEAVVPSHGHGELRTLEPLAALYDRAAFLREGRLVYEAGHGSVRRVVECLRTRDFTCDDPLVFTNLNTPADYAALKARERQPA